MSADLWRTKLAAWLHDPAEKALVLMRDVDNRGQRIGHEEGSVAQLRNELGIAKSHFRRDVDHWAAAADRPQWPCEDGKPRPEWANVRFVERPVLIHPLSGEEIDLEKLTEIAAPHIRNASLGHFLELIEHDADGRPDHRLTLLAFWRFGPEPKLAAPELGELWRLLPADTRVPDHSIWSHLDVVSALAGATTDGSPALLTMSFGPVQGFIAQARSTSDLWAGSHLLSSLVWEGLRVVCEELGPDALLYPHLRGVAAVDRWLLSVVPDGRREVWRRRFSEIGAEWLDSVSDANPLFAATLPNKFMALVPAGRARELAEKVTETVRAKALEWALQAAFKVFDGAGRDTGESAHWRRQVAEQLRGFPEAHWSVADWPTATGADRFPLTKALDQALAAFLEERPSRFVVNTHIMALANDLEALDAKLAAPDARARIEALLVDEDRAPALPCSLVKLRKSLAARIPAALNRLRDAGDEDRLRLLEREVAGLLGHKPEAYYALIQMDGDRMGAWMAGNEPAFRLPFSKTWHEQVRSAVATRFGTNDAIRAYMDAPRPASPARHAAISRVLNDFSTHVARHIVEEVFKGKLLYAGGDDVLAMVSVDDLLPAMLLLRAAYSGMGGGVAGLRAGLDLKRLQLGRGYVQLRDRLMPMMGSRASACMGAVVAHHQAPLAMVLRELRQAESKAKNEGGRDAFCLRILKRAGGEVGVTDKWFRTPSLPASQPPAGEGCSAAGLLDELMHMLARKGVSRRAAYNSVEWLATLPEKPDSALLAANLAYQFGRQGGDRELGCRLAEYATCHHPDTAARTLTDFLMTAEFLARSSRVTEEMQ